LVLLARRLRDDLSGGSADTSKRWNDVDKCATLITATTPGTPTGDGTVANMTLATISAPTGHPTQLVVPDQLRHSHQIDLSCGYDY